LDTESIQREAIAELRRVIGFGRWCAPFADQQTLIPLSGVAEHDYGPWLARFLELEYSGADFATMDVPSPAARPGREPEQRDQGDTARSPRWDEILRPLGIGDEAVLACRDALGCWGWIKVYRDGGEPDFTEDDLELLAAAPRAGIGSTTLAPDGPPSAPGGSCSIAICPW
jgi:hypothetical protein